jgi:glutamine cyclotransferase
VMKFDVSTGNLVRTYDVTILAELEALTPGEQAPSWQAKEDQVSNVLSGLAYDPSSNSFYLKGKKWHLVI